MSVVYDRKFVIPAEPSGDLHCTICSDKVHEPYVVWHTYSDEETTLRFCDECCRRHARGLMKDFVEINAVKEINRIDGLHLGVELRRVNAVTARKEREAQAAEEERLANEFGLTLVRNADFKFV